MPKRRVYEYCYLYKVAKQNLEAAEQQEEGQFYRLITCLGFCAFLLESVMNEIGDALFTECWMSEHERKQPKDKRDLIHARLDMLCANGEQPFQTFHNVFNTRSLLVHAKPQKLQGSGSKSAASLAGQYGPETEIELIATPKNVRLIFEDTEAMVRKWVAALPANTHFGLQFPSGPFEVSSHG